MLSQNQTCYRDSRLILANDLITGQNGRFWRRPVTKPHFINFSNYLQALKYENFADVGSSAEESENEDGDNNGSIYNNNEDSHNIERMIENSMTESNSNFGGETSSTDNNLEDSKTGKISHQSSI